jgi:hypothetical protein
MHTDQCIFYCVKSEVSRDYGHPFFVMAIVEFRHFRFSFRFPAGKLGENDS